MNLETHVARSNADQFPREFIDALDQNISIYRAFEREALSVVRAGHSHYSARTILEVLRHHSAISEPNSEFKLNNNHTPYLGRLFALMNPMYARRFEFRATFTPKRSREVSHA